MQVLGVDPGSQNLGFGILEVGPRLRATSFGVIHGGAGEFASRLGIILTEFSRLIAAKRPSVIVLERVFLGKNVDSAFKLGHARGLVVACAAQTGIPLIEYAARQVKKGVTGSGAADKEQVATCVLAHLGLRLTSKLPFDATDALALALHHTLLMTRPGGRALDLNP